jgi:hypothetical protein
MLDDGERHLRKRLQDTLGGGLISALVAVFGVQPGEFGLTPLSRATQGKFHHGQHPNTSRQQIREPLDLVIALGKHRGNLHTALQAMENPLDAVCVTRA